MPQALVNSAEKPRYVGMPGKSGKGQDMLRMLHFLWRHAWGMYETHPNRATRKIFNTLDALHSRIAYPGGSQACICNDHGAWKDRNHGN